MNEMQKDMLHALRMDHGHTTAHEMQICKTCTRRAQEMHDIAMKYVNEPEMLSEDWMTDWKLATW